MYTSTLLLALLPVVLAQYGDTNAGTDSTSSAGGSTATGTAAASIPSVSNVQQVKVSNKAGNLTFDPNSLTAAPGSEIEFIFYPADHSVAEASFAEPCQPLNGSVGFFSGAQKVAAGSVDSTVYTITVNNTSPIWFYCATAKHCQSGMVGVINPPAGKTVEMFAAAAALAPNNVAPSVVQGGNLIAAASVVPPTGTGSAAAASSSGAGVPSTGGIHWTLLGLTGAAAAGVGGLIL